MMVQMVNSFNGLIQDVFPGIRVEEIDYKILTDNIIKTLEEMKLEKIPTQIKKILELYAALQQRMGVVLVGPSGCGKTVLLNVLHGALKKMGNSVVRHVMNPKALERSVLLGYMDNDTRVCASHLLPSSHIQTAFGISVMVMLISLIDTHRNGLMVY
jgi:dynein heavy chain 2